MDGTGTPDDPWQLTTAPGSSTYTTHRDETSDPPLLVCQVGTTRLTYLLTAIDDLHAMLHEGTVEAWGRAEDNPVEGLGLVELEHLPRNNRVRALPA